MQNKTKLLSSLLALQFLAACGDGLQSQSDVKVNGGHFFSAADKLYRQHVTVLSSSGRCSGTILNSHWILTAAHCVDSATQASGAVYTHNASAIDLSGSYKIAEVLVPDGVSIGSGPDSTMAAGVKVWQAVPMVDIALLRLASDIPLNEHHVAARLPNLSDPALVGSAKLWAVGSGVHDHLPNDHADVKWKEVEVSNVDYFTDSFNLSESVANEGDSGGGLLSLSNYDGRTVVWAVTSNGNDSWLFNTSGYTFIGGRHQLWINSHIWQ